MTHPDSSLLNMLPRDMRKHPHSDSELLEGPCIQQKHGFAKLHRVQSDSELTKRQAELSKTTHTDTFDAEREQAVFETLSPCPVNPGLKTTSISRALSESTQLLSTYATPAQEHTPVMTAATAHGTHAEEAANHGTPEKATRLAEVSSSYPQRVIVAMQDIFI